MRVCLILEGCYPYVRGGVSTWAHEYIKANPEIEYVLWTIHADRKTADKLLYELPDNIVEHHTVFLEDAYKLSNRKADENSAKEAIDALKTFLKTEDADFSGALKTLTDKNFSAFDIANSQCFLDYAIELASKDEKVGLSDAFYGLKSMLLPILHLLSQDVPEADLYHSAVTGYGGILGALAKFKTNKPFVLTEHGIYPREREEELIQSDCVVSSMKKLWIDMFYNLSKCAYLYADKVTSLFENARKKQIELGCDQNKTSIVQNGIHFELFENIKERKKSDIINIGSITRFAPIKDIKTLIYAFYEAQRNVNNIELYLMGGSDDDVYMDECIELIKRLGIEDLVHIEGHIDTVEYIKEMDFTILTSISEGQPLAVLESLASLRPCITTKVGNCVALLEGLDDKFGEAGICCSPMNVMEIAAAIEKMSCDTELRQKFGKNGRTRISHNYTHEIMNSKYLKIYDEVLK